jgi:hypothetical protein
MCEISFAAFDRADTRLRLILHFPLSEEPAAEFGQGKNKQRTPKFPILPATSIWTNLPWLFAFRA